ncbi:hypothetical protein ACH4FE_35750 [Streptomyces celluloflavus]|uniref:hypothetical protein n=1 Tax=Streptomyces celluloflavus TaxID=58344 RepID=UPI0037B2146A
MTRTIGLAHALDNSGLPRETPAPVPAALSPAPAAPADLSRYHHPHFQRAEPGRHEGWVSYFFTAFTGREAEPVTPLAAYKDQTLTWDQVGELSQQYDAARIMWSHARLRLQAAPVLRKAASLWQAQATARDEMRSVFRGFWTAEDGRWRARLLRLTDAERTAKAAAAAWDEVAEQLAKLTAEQVRAAGWDDELPLGTVAQELGLDMPGWWIGQVNDYAPRAYYDRRDTPLVAELVREIGQQRERLREVAQLAGDRELA